MMGRKMKDSGIEWIGKIPEGWNVVKIKHLADVTDPNSFIDGDWIESPFITDNGIRYLTTGNIGDGAFKRQGNGYISKETFDILNCKYAYPNDLVISRLNEPYGRACILPFDNDKYVLAVDIVILRTTESKEYLCYLFQCEGHHNAVKDLAKGTTMKRISRTNLGNIALCLPSIQDQLSIASCLDFQCAEIDKVLEKTRTSIEEYKKLKQAVITQAVTRGVRGKRAMKDSGIEWIEKIPEEWDISRLKANFSFGKGLPITKENLKESGVPVISYGQIHSKANTGVANSPELERFVDSAFLESNPTSLVHKGDFIVADTSEDLEGCGNCVFVDKEKELFAGYHTIILFSKNEQLDGKFMAYQFKCNLWRNQLRSRVFGVKLFSITRKILNEASLLCPPMQEQCEIVALLDSKCAAIDKLIAKKEQLITELESYKKSLIYEYATGKKEVPV